MTARNIAVIYENESNLQVLAKLMDAMVNQLGFTLIENSISTDSFFVVQHQGSPNPWNRMILKVQHHTATDDYIAFVPIGQWVAGSPGKGYWSVKYNDPDDSPTTYRQYRYHEVALSTANEGGVFYLDCDDEDGAYFVVQSAMFTSADAWIISNVTTLVFCCSHESEYTPNYGLVVWCDAQSTPKYLDPTNNANYAIWCPPYAHNWAVCKHADYERTVNSNPSSYLLVGAYSFPKVGSVSWGPEVEDTNTGEKLAVPLMIFGTTHGLTYERSAPGYATGTRGFAKKVLGFGMNLGATGRHEGQRFVVEHGGQRYMCVATGKAGTGTNSSPLMLVPLDPDFAGYIY